MTVATDVVDPADFEESAEKTTGKTPLIIKLLVAATFVVILNETIMINAMPSLMVDFEVTARTAQWLSSIFMLTMAAVIPITGWFLQRVTTRTAFTVAMVVFGTGTAIAGLAPTFEVLLAARGIQAAGTAVMMPLLMTTLMQVVAEKDRGRVMGQVTLAISVAPALGPAISGLILQLGSWRLIFAFVLPVAAGVTVFGLRHLKNVGETKVGPVSWTSVALAGIGFSALVYGLSEIGARSGGQLGVIIGIGVVFVAAFVAYQLRLQSSGSPLLDLRTLKHRNYAVTLVLMSIAFMAFLGSMILLPLYLQDIRGLSAVQTGLLVMPGGIAMGLLGPRVGRIYDLKGARVLVIPGAIVMVAALGALSRIQADTPYALILVVHVILMVSLAAIFTPVFTLGLGDLTPELYSHGSSLLGTLQQVAGAVGTAALIVILENRSSALVERGSEADAAFVGGLQWAFIAGAVLGVIVVALSLLLPPKQEGAAASVH
ncbi:multidrug efflux MFS transporter [Antrihabitans sp. YC3-6]|uniref:Multidrug efflux MFS transporter n=1 Tax=Antrihabitans stalagmiti TaxID=2799499 RepID=A0A934U6K5_9NOCA|nr:MDR family MFS transporter [Antrihabitans stalagmiti]MBJ8342675.1 multidrug efflux MFS transporter [Antrihabitans stalagmiti]